MGRAGDSPARPIALGALPAAKFGSPAGNGYAARPSANGAAMINVFHSGRSAGQCHQLHTALQGALRAGERIIEFRPEGAARLELDDVGGIHRIPLAPHAVRADA